jgi:GntR family transcriptional regulator
VRKAIDLLVAEGLLERYQGRGTFVRRASFDGSLFRFFRFQSKSGERRIPKSQILKRSVVIEDAPVLTEDIWLPLDRFAAFVDLPLDSIGDLLYPVYEAICNQVVASATETLTVEAASPKHAKLLGIEKGTAIVVIERLAYGYDRHPLEWRRSRGPASQFLYQSEIR